MLRRCTNRLPVDVLCCRRASSHPPYIGPDESRLGGGNPRPAPSTPCAPTLTPTTTSVDACRSRDHSAQAIDASRLGVRREHCVAGRWHGSELFTMNASDKGKAVASRWSRLNRTCTMIGRRTGCSVAPDQQCKLVTLKGLAPQAGFEPATLRLTEAALTFHRLRLMMMKVRTINELRPSCCRPSLTVNLHRSPFVEWVMSQTMSQAAPNASACRP